MKTHEKVIAITVAALLFVIAASGCSQPPKAVQHPEPQAVAPGDQPAPTPEVYSPVDVAETVEGVAVVVEQVSDTGRVSSEDVRQLNDSLGPILNPLTAGWFSAVAGIGFGILQRREARKRREMLRAVQDNPDTPDVRDQVRYEGGWKLANEAAKVVQ